MASMVSPSKGTSTVKRRYGAMGNYASYTSGFSSLFATSPYLPAATPTVPRYTRRKLEDDNAYFSPQGYAQRTGRWGVSRDNKSMAHLQGIYTNGYHGAERTSPAIVASPHEDRLAELEAKAKEAENLFNRAIELATASISGQGTSPLVDRHRDDRVQSYRAQRSRYDPEALKVDFKSLASYKKLIALSNTIDPAPYGTPAKVRPLQFTTPASPVVVDLASPLRDPVLSPGPTTSEGETSRVGGEIMQACKPTLDKFRSLQERSLANAEAEEKQLKEMKDLRKQLDTLDLARQQGSYQEIDSLLKREQEGERSGLTMAKGDLSPEMEALYEEIMDPDQAEDKVVSTHKTLKLHIRDMRSLLPTEWLTDENINFYMSLLNDRARRLAEEDQGAPTCYFTNTFFLQKLSRAKRQYDYKGVRTWTRKKKIGIDTTRCDKIIVPVHQKLHWCCAVVDVSKRELVYYDSMLGKDREVLDHLGMWLMDEYKDKSDDTIDTTEWERKFPRKIPTQENGYDCGVFAVKFAEASGLGSDPDFGQEDMQVFRRQMVCQLAKVDLEAIR